jgi:LuxR family maltose regulon positive regulatory protein
MGLIRMKIQVPRRRPDILRRQRLLDFLANHRRQKLLLLCAPAGYGKTTLMVDYASDPTRAVCWYSLEESDRDPVVFLRYLAESIRQRFPCFGARTLQMLELVQGQLMEQPADDRLDEVIETLLNELYEAVADDFIIVLNDYQVVMAPGIDGLLVRLLRYLPDNGQVILLSREVPSLDLPRMAACREVAGLGIEEFRFTPAEVREFLRRSGAGEFSEQEAQALVDRFGGWITGIILGTHMVVRGLVPRLSDEGENNAQLFAYLALEVLERQSAEVQRFLLDTAILPRFTVALCNTLLERTDSQALLHAIEAKGLFLEHLGEDAGMHGGQEIGGAYAHDAAPGRHCSQESGAKWPSRDEETVWYRYHQLFRDFLCSQLRAREPERMRLLCRRAAEFFVTSGEPENAIPLLLTVGAYERAAQLIQEASYGLLTAGQLEGYSRWLAELPPALLREQPGLLLLQAQIRCRSGQPDVALELAQHAEMLCAQRHDVPAQVEALLERCRALQWLGRCAEVSPLCHRAATLLDEFVADSSLMQVHSSFVARVHQRLGSVFTSCGEIAAARAQFLRSMDRAHESGDAAGTARAHYYLGVALGMLAEDSDAEFHLREATRVWSMMGGQRGKQAEALGLTTLAILYRYQGRYELALKTLWEAQHILRRTSATASYMHGAIMATMADTQRDMGQGVQAEALYAEAWGIAQQARADHLSFWVVRGRAENQACHGELAVARILADQALHLLPREEANYARGELYLTQALIAGRSRDSGAAIVCVRQARELLHASGRLRPWVRAMVRLATLLAYQGTMAEAVQVLVELLERIVLAEIPLSLLHVFAAEGGGLLPALSSALGQQEGLSTALRERAQWLMDWLQAIYRMPEGVAEREGMSQAGAQRSQVPGAVTIVSPGVGLPPSESAACQEALVETGTLRIVALGDPRVYLGDQLITEWRSAKALELLLYFVECAVPQHKEEVLEALWPEAPLQRADVLFRSTMYRLRRAIGPDGLVYRHGLYSLELVYDYDVRDFAEALAEARQWEAEARRTGSPLPPEALAAYRRAISLYGGDYCESVYSDWCRARRDALRQAYLEALVRLAQAEWEAEHLDESAALWQRVLSVDPCVEEAHRGLIVCYAARGQRVMVARQYRCCLRALEALDVPPSPETVAAYRRAISQRPAVPAVLSALSETFIGTNGT